MARAIQALTLNEDCRKLFGNKKTRANGFDPSAVLTSIATGGKFGSIEFADRGPSWGVAKTTPAGVVLPRLRPPFVSSNKVTITINSFDDAKLYWNDAKTDGNASTLLHELGHAFNFLRGSGGSQLRNLGEFTDDKVNDRLIKETCFP